MVGFEWCVCPVKNLNMISIDFLLFVAICAAAFGAKESRIVVSGEGWSGATNGWTFAGIGADGAMGTGSVIESPRWPKAEILTATITLCCSTNRPDRFVEVSFLYDDDLPTRAIRVGAVARADCREEQSIDANPERIARGIRLTLSAGDVGDWQIAGVAIDYEGSLKLPHAERGFRILISRC